MPDDVAKNTEFVDFWNEILVPKFITFKHVLVDGLTHHSEAIFSSLQVNEGDSVLDVGCGFGDTAIRLARLVGPTGRVVGLDCCDAFIEYGREAADEEGLENVSFVNGDALVYPFEPEYDFVFSRFGTMFFSNPVAGLRSMRSALKPGGVVTHIGGCAWPRISFCVFCRRPAKTPRPAAPVRFPWPIRTWSPA